MYSSPGIIFTLLIPRIREQNQNYGSPKMLFHQKPENSVTSFFISTDTVRASYFVIQHIYNKELLTTE